MRLGNDDGYRVTERMITHRKVYIGVSRNHWEGNVNMLFKAV